MHKLATRAYQILFFAGLIIAASPHSHADATLISMNDPVFGPNSSTLDTQTGLEWLDLTKSTNISFNQMVARMASSGDPFSQWQYASLSQVSTLWLDAGIPNIGSTFTASNLTPVTNLLNNYIGTTLNGFETRGITKTLSTNSVFTNFQPKLTIGGVPDTTPGHGGAISGPPGTARADLNWIESGSLAAPYLGHWLLRTPSAHDSFVGGFNSLVTNFVSPGPLVSQQQLVTSQQTALQTADSVRMVAQGIGTPQQATTKQVTFADVAEVVLNFVDIYSAILSFPFLHLSPFLICPEGNCLLQILPGSGRLIQASFYDLFDFQLPLEVPEDQLGFFNPGDRFIVNSSVLGGPLPSFSAFEVVDIQGTTVNMLVHNVSQIPDPVPEPSTLLLLATVLAGCAMFTRRRAPVSRHFGRLAPKYAVAASLDGSEQAARFLARRASAILGPAQRGAGCSPSSAVCRASDEPEPAPRTVVHR